LELVNAVRIILFKYPSVRPTEIPTDRELMLKELTNLVLLRTVQL